MTAAEWDLITEQALITWGRTPDADRRLAFWHHRWLAMPYERMRLALKMLERQCDAWPGPAKMHAVLDQLEGSARSRIREPSQRDPPLSATEWREWSERLFTAADDSRDAGRATSGNLQQLAAFYADNAQRLERGEKPDWPAPKWAGALGAVLERASRGIAPAVRQLPGLGQPMNPQQQPPQQKGASMTPHDRPSMRAPA